ncbi:uncharacterized protein LOC108028570 [Drosophila biarmipes]|uniref:uncharacterized protein LOC108028570 n=1 Tax=Drosophila biarmipes TaxID=125945 RepID=UPI0007E827DF|nr:uncharacterized protein LOC108028570 [Drosophila biarmipes]
MIEIRGLGTLWMWGGLEYSGLAIENCQCLREQRLTQRSTDKPLIPRVTLRYQPSFLAIGIALTICFGSALGAPQTSCIMCDKEDLRPRVPPYTDSYEEYTFDHQVTQKAAIESMLKFNGTKGQNNACSSIKCPPNTSKYCLGEQFINDHCWCELQHREEGLPYVPHVCFADQKVHTSSVESCFTFVQVKECCCAEIWFKKWRRVSGSSRSQHIPKILVHLLSALSVIHWLSRRRTFC